MIRDCPHCRYIRKGGHVCPHCGMTEEQAILYAALTPEENGSLMTQPEIDAVLADLAQANDEIPF